jgi:class 3 adenylate cyclase
VDIPSLAELLRLARQFRDEAQDAAEEINLSMIEANVEKHSEHYGRTGSKHLMLLGDKPRLRDLPHFHGLRAWGAFLCFDTRQSSDLAEELGPRGTYILLHAYMPTMLTFVEELEGDIVGLRGDGAIACFGMVEQGDDKPPVTEEQGKKAIVAACDCGHFMVQAMQKVVNPILREGQILTSKVLGGRIRVGVGIDVGDFVATRIGLIRARDLTAYGRPVNRCCKFSYGQDQVILTNRARAVFPKGRGGKTRFDPDSRKEGDFILRYPDGYKTLA